MAVACRSHSSHVSPSLFQEHGLKDLLEKALAAIEGEKPEDPVKYLQALLAEAGENGHKRVKTDTAAWSGFPSPGDLCWREEAKATEGGLDMETPRKWSISHDIQANRPIFYLSKLYLYCHGSRGQIGGGHGWANARGGLHRVYGRQEIRSGP